MKLESDIGLARPHAVPFPIADHAAARQHAPVDAVVILHNRPPAERERRRRAPITRTESQPILRDVERCHYVPLGLPAVKESSQGDGPVTIEPSAHELLTTRRPQPLLVRLNVYVLVVVDLRR